MGNSRSFPARDARYAFAILGLASSALALLALIGWAKGDFESLAWIGIAGWWHAGALFATSGVLAFLLAGWLLGSPVDNRLSGATRGSAIAALTFVGTLLVHGSILQLTMHVSTAAWLTLSAAFFGGVVFGLPSILLGAILGALVSRKKTPQ